MKGSAYFPLSLGTGVHLQSISTID